MINATDPNIALARIRALVSQALTDEGLDKSQTAELAKLIQILDIWLSTGGFLPQPWSSPGEAEA